MRSSNRGKKEMQQNEQVLVDRFCGGDHTAFHELVGQYKKKIYYLACDITGDHQEAEDISQEVFLRVYRFLDGFKKQCRFSTWLYRITINVCFNAQRKRKEEPKMAIPSWEVANVGSNPGTPQLEDESFSPRKALEKKELTTKIKSAIDSLPEVLKMTFILREFEDLSYKELAKALRCSEGTIKSRLCRARETLRQELEIYLSEGR